MDQHSVTFDDDDNTNEGQSEEQELANLATVNSKRQQLKQWAVVSAPVSVQRQPPQQLPEKLASVGWARLTTERTNRPTVAGRTTDKQSANLPAGIQPRDPKGECVC